MKRTFSTLALALLVGAAAPAATISTTLTVTGATLTLGTSAAITGPMTLTNIGSGTFSAPALTADSSGNYSGPYSITITGGSDKITGTLKIPGTAISAALTGGALTGSATVTGGAGTYSGATGSFPSLTGSGSLNTSTFAINVTFSGAGTITTGGAPPPPVPTITDVLDAGSYTADIAQGSIFVVKGTTLSASGYTPMSFPLPTSSSGVKITFTPAAGGAGTDAYLVYLYNLAGVNQLAAVLPSSVAAGNYNVTVTNGTVSAPFAAKVVQRKLGLITADSTGGGLAVIQNYISASQLDIDRFTTFASGIYTFSPSRPGQILIAWATGMGPVTGGDNVASPGYDFNANGVNVKVIVGGVSITPLYAGRAPGLAGADQINFQLPSNIPTGCTVSFQVSVNGVLSNPSFIAIAPDANANACVMPGFTTSQLQQYDNGLSFTAGGFTLVQVSQTIPELGSVTSKFASGGFTKYTGFQLPALAQYQARTSTSGACSVTHIAGKASQAALTSTIKGLDAGAVTLSGPGGLNQPITQDAKTNAYFTLLTSDLAAGTYTVTGAGGQEVGKFSASVGLGSPLTITGGLPSVVNRGAGLTLNWTGGNASDFVQIQGESSTTTGSGSSAVDDTWMFICTTTAGAKTFTVPASILKQLPAVSASDITNGTGFGLLQVASGVPSPLTAPLVAGGNIDAGTFAALVGIATYPAYQ